MDLWCISFSPIRVSAGSMHKTARHNLDQIDNPIYQETNEHEKFVLWLKDYGHILGMEDEVIYSASELNPRLLEAVMRWHDPQSHVRTVQQAQTCSSYVFKNGVKVLELCTANAAVSKHLALLKRYQSFTNYCTIRHTSRHFDRENCIFCF